MRSWTLFAAALALSACSLATDFGRFEAKGSLDDLDGGGTDEDPGGDGDFDGSPGGDGGGDGGATQPGEIAIEIEGPGSGTVSSEPAGIDCGDTCSHVFESGTGVTLTATAAEGSVFVSWGGACADQEGPVCVLVAGDAANVRATFALALDLIVMRMGNGAGVVTSEDGLINCNGTATEVCSARYPVGATVKLSAESSGTGSSFSGWGGACMGTGTCEITMSTTRMVNAVFDTDTEASLIVSNIGTGLGTVTSDPVGIDCGLDCAEPYTLPVGAAPPITVTLTALPDGNSNFKAFTGCTAINATQCTTTMDQVRSVTAEFELKQYKLDVKWSGQGAGGVAATTPAGLSCTKPQADCVENYDFGTEVTLLATPAAGSKFSSWSGGGCGTNPMCTVTISQDKYLVASFALKSYEFVAGVSGDGELLCNGQACPSSYLHGTEVTISAVPGAGSQLNDWSGACDGTPAGDDCELTISGDTNVSATFVKKKYTVSVTVSGNGAVTGTIPCDSGTCQMQITHGAALSLSADPDANTNFGGWSGDCGGTGACSIADVTSALAITANFVAAGQKSLSLSKTGRGTVTSSPAGIDCGEACTGDNASFGAGADVELTATAATGYTFAGFTGCDSTSGSDDSVCSIDMNDDVESVSATFTANPYAVSVDVTGPGTVTGTGINCADTSGDCAQNVAFDNTITLTATPSTGAEFVGWTGDCSGASSTCNVTVSTTDGMQVGAVFALKTFTVQVATTGGFDTTNSVGFAPTGAACSPASDGCRKYDYGTDVTLTATPGTGSNFVKWVGGPCNNSTSATCNINDIAANQTTTAQFSVRSYTLSMLTNGQPGVIGPGVVTSGEQTPLIKCGSGNVTCSAQYSHGSSVTLTAAASGGRFGAWAGACSSFGTTPTCTLSMTQARNATATFIPVYKLTVQLTGTGAGGLDPLVTGTGDVSCSTIGGTCVVNLDGGTAVTLTSSAPKWATADGYTGCTSSTSTSCSLTLSEDTTVSAKFVAKGALVFVTSKVFTGSLGGLDGADSKCQSLANDQQLPGSYVPWLSDDVGARERFRRIGENTPLIRVDGALVAKEGFEQVGKGTLTNPITIAEDGSDISKVLLGETRVWTGTYTDGTSTLSKDGSLCESWSAATKFSVQYGIGDATATDATWTTAGGGIIIRDPIAVGCATKLRLYCVRDIAIAP